MALQISCYPHVVLFSKIQKHRRYDEKPEKGGQRCDICDIYRDKKEHTVLIGSTESISWGHNRLHDTCNFPKYFKPFSSKVNDSLFSETLKHIFKAYL